MHSVARSGFNAVGASGLYDSARPSYPAEAISAILRASVPSPPRPLRIIELGAGTGIATRVLLETANSKAHGADSQSPLPSIASILAFEPAEGMRDEFQRRVVDAWRGKGDSAVDIRVEDGTFEDFPAGDGGADCLLAAQAFHWCHGHESFVRNASKALRPGGVIALLWNIEDKDGAPWVAKLREQYQAYEGEGVPQYHHGTWKSLLTNKVFLKHFAPLDELHIKRTIPTTIDGVKNRVFSKSYISILPEETRATLGEYIDQLFSPATAEGEKALGRVWIDKEKGVWQYPYVTDLFLFRRL